MGLLLDDGGREVDEPVDDEQVGALPATHNLTVTTGWRYGGNAIRVMGADSGWMRGGRTMEAAIEGSGECA